MRLLAGLPVVALVGVAAAGCAPFHAGAAATVGNGRITTDQLRSVADRVVAARPAVDTLGTQAATQPQVQQRSLSSLVALEVLGHSGVAATPSQIGEAKIEIESEVAQSAFGSSAQLPDTTTPAVAGAAESVLAEAGYDLASLAGVRATVEAQTTALDIDDLVPPAYAQLTDRSGYVVEMVQTPDLLQALALDRTLTSAPKTFDAVAAAAGLTPVTTSLSTSYVQTQTQVSAPDVVGSTIGPIELATGGFGVAVVQQVGTISLLEADLPYSSLRQELKTTDFARTYATVVGRLGVHINPRFGAWNGKSVDAVGDPVGIVGAGGTQLSVVAKIGN